MSAPLVSIMLPVRSAGDTLEAAVRSCLDQSFENFELLLLPNQPDEETGDAIGRVQEQGDPRVYVHPAYGFFEALETGWRRARGELLARMDADDLCHPDRLAGQVRFLVENPRIAACGTLVEIRKQCSDGSVGPPDEGYRLFEDWLNSLRTPADHARERFIDQPIANPTAMIRREVFDTVGGYRERVWAEDYDFWLRVLEAGLEIAKVPEVLLTWRDGPSRLTRTHGRYGQVEFLRAKAHFLARLPAVRDKGVAICGAGPIGKTLARFLTEEEARIHALVEVSPRRIGNFIGGVPVVGSDWLQNRAGEVVLLGAVGLRGARERLRALVDPLGCVEGVDFFLVA